MKMHIKTGRLAVILNPVMRYLTTLFLLVLFSCKKDDAAPADSQVPVILLTTPSNAQVFSPGQAVTIKANISDNQKIREVHLEIINTTTGAFITHEHFTPVNNEYMLNRTFTAQASAAYRIKIEAEDLQQNKAKAEITISAN